ncbi:MAG: PAS domain S-box protein [Thermoanaerobaculaceae bacterium]|nr:PAS domain S-box protein [Thermoanaerobaculaceae bacterium]MDI9620519.1 CHASE4 domain-containing protein [Acidobacteriota bacterium]NLH11960.1 PAS domain S-box protein [Holophagae bacterium]HPW55242.1 CHASE4 domain-containing protein [Thermoanaerobaculaceae bacterium]
MGLRARVLVFTSLAFAVLIGMLYGSLRAIALPRFTELESQEVRRDVERAVEGLQRELDALETVCADWAQWDDTYRFMVEDHPEFEAAALVLASLANLDLDAVVFVAPSGDIRRAIGLDPGRTRVQPIPSELLPALTAGRALGRTADQPRRVGLVALPEGVMLVAVRAILTSKASGGSHGSLVMARFVSAEKIRALGTSLRLDIAATVFAAVPTSIAGLRREDLAAATVPSVVELDESRVAGLIVLRDLAGRPALLLRVDRSRSFYQQGRANIRSLLAALVVVTSLIAGGVLLLLEHSVLAPLSRLGTALRTIGVSGLPSGRVPVTGKDELARVARQINDMLEALEAGRERLRASEARFRHLVETAPDVIFTIATATGRITSLSPAFERLTGWPVTSWIGRKALALVAPPDRARAVRTVAGLLGGEASASLELRLRTASGGLVDCDIAAARESTGGPVTGVLGVARDITTRKRLEAEVVHTQKMQAIGMLTGGVAHDFNNLLQAQMSLVQLLRWRREDAARQERIVGELETLIRRGAALTRQLLVFARKDVSKREELDLADVLRDAVLLAQRLVRENICIEATIGTGKMPILGDRGQLGQVLLNLVTNAVDAMPDGGRIVLRAERVGAGEAYIEIADNGGGIPDEVKTRLFEPFVTTKKAGQGTGLGLAVVDSIVTAHGGRVSVQSVLGSGSTFRVTLPLRTETGPVAAASPSASVRLVEGRGERVLLVEDEDGAREALRETLVSLGYEVLAVASAEEAGVVPAAPEYELLLTDQMLPGAAGIDLATGLVDRWPDLAVIVMSGYSEGQILQRAVQRRLVRFLQKPFDLATLTSEVRAALDARAAALAGR